MILIVMSGSNTVPDEPSKVVQMFKEGLHYYHIRKPRYTQKQLEEYILQFPQEYHKKLILHSHHRLAFRHKLGGIHLSRKHRQRSVGYRIKLWLLRKINPHLVVTRTFQRLTEISTDHRRYTYGFLNPVFDGISTHSLSGDFSPRALGLLLPHSPCPILALGGVTHKNLAEVQRLGFKGAALSGFVWKNSNPVAAFHLAAEALYHNSSVSPTK